MAGTAREALIQILREFPQGTAPLVVVERKLAESGVLGLGVEPIDVVHAAGRAKIVYFDPDRRTVTLLNQIKGEGKTLGAKISGNPEESAPGSKPTELLCCSLSRERVANFSACFFYRGFLDGSLGELFDAVRKGEINYQEAIRIFALNGVDWAKIADWAKKNLTDLEKEELRVALLALLRE